MRTSRFINDALFMLDRSGMTRCVFDEARGRLAIVRRSPFSPRSNQKVLMHICKPSDFEGSHFDALQCQDVMEKMKSGEFVGCPTCGEVHGEYKEADYEDIRKLVNSYPVYYPGGVEAYLEAHFKAIAELERQSQKAREERWGESIDEAAFWLRQMSGDMSNNTITKEEIREVSKRRERQTERRLRERGAAS